MKECLFYVKNHIHGTKDKEIISVFHVIERDGIAYFLVYDSEKHRFRYKDSKYFSPIIDKLKEK